MSVINTNITSLIGQSNLSKSQSALQTSMERLSSGLRINSAKDDAAGQAIANRMTAQITGLAQAQRNANDGISIAQTAEGSLNQINDNLQRIRELSVQAQNGTNSGDDLKSIQDEINQRLSEIDRISSETNFNGTKVLASDQGLKIQVGANDGETISVNLKQINSKTLGLDGFNVDGNGVTQNRTATVTDLLAAGGTEASGVYTVTTNHEAVSLDRMLQELKSGDKVTTDVGGDPVEYTFDATSGNFTFDNVVADNSALATKLQPKSGTASGVYEFQSGAKANFEVDATGKLTIGGQAAYLNDDGELTTNDADGTGSQATLKDLLDEAAATVNQSVTLGGVTYTGGAGADNDQLGFVDTATVEQVKTAANGAATNIDLSNGLTAGSVSFDANGDTSDAYVDGSGELTKTASFTNTYNVNAETGEVTVAGNGTGAEGKYASEIGSTVYLSASGSLTTDTTSKGERTENPLAALDTALNQVDALRSELGAVQNRFEDAITNLNTNATNLSAARSRIEDADYAVEVANMTRAQILQQAGTSVLAQANQIPQNVLSLLG